MTVARMHNLYAVKIGSTVIGAISKRGIRTGAEVRQQATSGEVFARFQALYAINAMADFETEQLAVALGACALTGTALTSAAPFVAYAQKNAEGGTRTSGSAHRKYTINEGIVIPRRLTCEHQGDAKLHYEVLATYDGTNEPVVVSESQSLPSVTDAERFTIGAITLADADGVTTYTLPQVKRIEIDFGIAAETVGADSDIYPTSCRIVEIQPSIRLTGIDSEWWKSNVIPLTGRNIQNSGTKIYLRKRAAGGSFTSDATAEHIKFAAAGMAVVEGFDSSGNALDEVSVYFPLKFDGSNNPITINPASAIT
jgi:hypothetical protein